MSYRQTGCIIRPNSDAVPLLHAVLKSSDLKVRFSLIADLQLSLHVRYVPGAGVIRPGYDNLRPLAFSLPGGICLIF